MFEPEFFGMMPALVTWKRFTGRSTDGYGQPTFSTTATVLRAHVSEDVGLIRQSWGQSTQIRSTLWIASTQAISPQDQITYSGTTMRVIDSRRLFDETGSHHVRVALG